MDKLDFNISLMIFALGAGLFLIAPLGLLGKAFSTVFEAAADRLVAAFCDRADRVYGN